MIHRARSDAFVSPLEAYRPTFSHGRVGEAGRCRASRGGRAHCRPNSFEWSSHVNTQPDGATTAESARLADDIRAAERARLRSLVAADMDTAASLHSESFQLITPIGALLDKTEYLGAVASGHIDYLLWEAGEIAVRFAGSAAIIRYRADLEVAFGGHRVARTQYWHTDSYELGADGWQAVWSQATAISVPGGPTA